MAPTAARRARPARRCGGRRSSGSLLGFLANDSGPIVIALFFVYLGPYLTLLALTRSGPAREPRRPSGDARPTPSAGRSAHRRRPPRDARAWAGPQGPAGLRPRPGPGHGVRPAGRDRPRPRPRRRGRRRATAPLGEAAELVARWAGAIRDRIDARRPRRGGHAQRLRPAPAVPGGLPGRRRGGAGQRPDARRRDRPRRRRLPAPPSSLRAAADLDGGGPPAAAPSTPTRATWPPSSTRRAPPAGPRAPSSPTGPWSARSSPAALWPSRLRRDEAVVEPAGGPHHGVRRRCWAWPCAGIPVYFLPRFDADEVLDAIEQRRVDDLHRRARHVPDDARGRRRGARPALGAAVGVGRRRHARRAGRALQAHGRQRHAARRRARWARPRSPRATAWSRRAGGAAAKVSPAAACPAAVGDASASRCPATAQGRRRRRRRGGARARSASCGCKGPGVLKGYHGDAEATAAALTDDGWLRTGDLARRGRFGTCSSPAGRRTSSCAAATPSTPSRSSRPSSSTPTVRRGGRGRPARRPAGRGARGRGAPRRGADVDGRGPDRAGPGAAAPVQGARAGRWSSTTSPHAAPARSRGPRSAPSSPRMSPAIVYGRRDPGGTTSTAGACCA